MSHLFLLLAFGRCGAWYTQSRLPHILGVLNLCEVPAVLELGYKYAPKKGTAQDNRMIIAPVGELRGNMKLPLCICHECGPQAVTRKAKRAQKDGRNKETKEGRKEALDTKEERKSE
jgi:hypothetical protein